MDLAIGGSGFIFVFGVLIKVPIAGVSTFFTKWRYLVRCTKRILLFVFSGLDPYSIYNEKVPADWTATSFDNIWHYSTSCDNIKHYSTVFHIFQKYSTLFNNMGHYCIQQNSTQFNIFRQWNKVVKCCGPRILPYNCGTAIKKSRCLLFGETYNIS